MRRFLAWLVGSVLSRQDQRRLDRIYDLTTGITTKIDGTLQPSRTVSPAKQEMKMPRTFADTIAAVQAASTRTDSIIAQYKATKQQVADLLASQGQLSPENQAALDSIFDIETSDAAKIDAAISEGTTPPASDPAKDPSVNT